MELRNSGQDVYTCGSEKPLTTWGRIEVGRKREQVMDLCVYFCPGLAHVRSGPAVRHLVGNWICGSGAQERERERYEI